MFFLAAYIPLDVAFPQNRIDHIVTESKPVMVNILIKYFILLLKFYF